MHVPGEHQMTSQPFKSTQNGRQILVAQQADGPSLGQSSNGTSLYRHLRGGGGIAVKFYDADRRLSVLKEVMSPARIS